MAFLRLLEGLRTPALTLFFSTITYMGDELVFMVLAITVFWCVSKRQGYYIFAVGLGGTVVNQWLKLAFRVPRPWVLDPGFTIVESARAGASGYSFPSGHTQNIVGTMGCLMLSNKNRLLRVLCAVFAVLVPFSRMYLGVHTPLDVGVGAACAVVLALALYPFFRDDDGFAQTVAAVLGALLALSLAYALWVSLTAFPADVDADNLASGVKNGWTLLGCALGLLVSHWYDGAKLHYDVRAPLRAGLQGRVGACAAAGAARGLETCVERGLRRGSVDERRALLHHGRVRRLPLAHDLPVFRAAGEALTKKALDKLAFANYTKGSWRKLIFF